MAKPGLGAPDEALVFYSALFLIELCGRNLIKAYNLRWTKDEINKF